MAEIEWDPDADAEMTRLEDDDDRAQLVQRIEEVLDHLEADPGNESVRLRRYLEGMWGVPIRWRDEDWLLLWEPHPERPTDVVVQYLGPDL